MFELNLGLSTDGSQPSNRGSTRHSAVNDFKCLSNNFDNVSLFHLTIISPGWCVLFSLSGLQGLLGVCKIYESSCTLNDKKGNSQMISFCYPWDYVLARFLQMSMVKVRSVRGCI
jgi:hypothetical protein